MTKAELLGFMRQYQVAVESTVSPDGAPESAVVGIAVGDEFEVVFDTFRTSRKASNLRSNPRIALVLGGWGSGEERTVQYEGLADEPAGSELDRIRSLYFSVYPDGQARLASWPELIHVRVRPRLVRYSDFGQSPARVVEISAQGLRTLAQDGDAVEQAVQADEARVELERGMERLPIPTGVSSPVRGSRRVLASQLNRGVGRLLESER